jgi:hypothetical protein
MVSEDIPNGTFDTLHIIIIGNIGVINRGNC